MVVDVGVEQLSVIGSLLLSLQMFQQPSPTTRRHSPSHQMRQQPSLSRPTSSTSSRKSSHGRARRPRRKRKYKYAWRVQASDNYFFERIAGYTPINYRNTTTSGLTGGTAAGGGASLCPGSSSPMDGKLSPSSRKSSRQTATGVIGGGGDSSYESEGSTSVSAVNAAAVAQTTAEALRRLALQSDMRGLHDLYVETLYTIVHKVGKSTSLPLPEAQLIRYAQNAFQIDDTTHQQLMDRARKEKPPMVLLNVQLLEARDLIAKDINGFSDPYAMLGVIPGQRPAGHRANGVGGAAENGAEGATGGDDSPPISPSAYSGHRASGSSGMLQRFGGSFRRKLAGGERSSAGSGSGSRKWPQKTSGTNEKGIPAKLIKASSVQYKTLNPKWNECFQLVVDDVASDKFHLDIWDHDDQEQSVLDAVTSLNQISGFKGLGRYFKEVTQSARAGSNDLIDDFLGSVTIRIKDIPSTGLEDWFALERRSEKSEVSGSVLLRLWLSTKEERRDSIASPMAPEKILRTVLDQDGLTDVRQHIELIRQFALQEIRSSGMQMSAFQGLLPEAAVTILHQHAIQGDLTELHQAMCQWLAYSVMIKFGISYGFLYAILTNLISKWRPLALDKEEENMLSDSFETFNEHCRRMIADHREFGSAPSPTQPPQAAPPPAGAAAETGIPPPSTVPLPGAQLCNTVMRRHDVDTFSNMIRCLKLMKESPIYCKCLPIHKQFIPEVTDILIDSASRYFYALKTECDGQQTACDEMHALVSGLNRACAKIPLFDSIFRTYAEIDYGTPTYGQFDALLFDYVRSEMMSEKKIDLKSMLLTVPENEVTIVIVLKLHCVMNEFSSFRKPKMNERKFNIRKIVIVSQLKKILRYQMEHVDWATTFDRTISKWLDLARVKAFARVDLACQLDAQIQISTSNEIRHTSSYVDVCHVIEQLAWVWEHVQVRDVTLHIELTEKLVSMICQVAEIYVDRVILQLAADGFCGQLQPFLPPALVSIFCSAINNVEQVRRVLSVGEKLGLDELSELYERRFKKEAHWRANIESELDRCEKYIGAQIESTVERLVRRQTAQLKKHVFHLAWSPAACPVEQSLKPLTDMLDAELSLVHRTLLHRNFVRIIYSQLNVLLQLLQDCVDENSGLEPSFYQRLSEAWNILAEFFHAEGKGISIESIQTIPAHQKLMAALSMNQRSTARLIEIYYRELLKEQNEANECRYGILNIRAYYNSKTQTLVVDVLSAKQVIPLDSNGLSDPFVVIELVPRMRFPSQPTARTKVVSRTLNPIFDETFEFQITPKSATGSLVHFVVMDHDFLRSNDFAGEALLDLNDVPGFGQAGVSNTLRQFNLILIHPSRMKKESVKVLASRKDDRDAQDFVRSLETNY